MPRILVTPALLHSTQGPYREVLEQAGFEVAFPSLPEADYHSPAGLLSQLHGIDGVIAGAEPYNRQVLVGSNLRVIARMGVGYDAVDIPCAVEKRIAVTITPGTNEVSVAESTLALMLGVFRGFPWRDSDVRSGTWRRRPLPRLGGKTLGLVGLGRIGRAVAPRAIGLELKVLAYDPLADRAFAEKHGVRLCPLDELLAASDIVSLHMPCTPQNTACVNAQWLAKMKRGSVLINTARGALVDEQALAAALASGHLFAAGLDVFEVEPLPLDSPLMKLENVLLSPHTGGVDEESFEAMGTLAARCIVDLHQGRWPEGCVVNSDLRGTWKW